MMQPDIFNDFEGDRDMANLRSLSLPDGTEIKLNRIDPYGLIEIQFIGTNNPKDFGSFTSFEQAKDALAVWYQNLPKVKKNK